MKVSHVLFLLLVLVIGYVLRGVFPQPAQALGLP